MLKDLGSAPRSAAGKRRGLAHTRSCTLILFAHTGGGGASDSLGSLQFWTLTV